MEERSGYPISHDTVRRYEEDGRVPVEYLLAVCEAFSVEPTWMLTGTGGDVAEAREDDGPDARRILRYLARIVEGLGSEDVSPEDLAALQRETWQTFVRQLDPEAPLAEVIREEWRGSLPLDFGVSRPVERFHRIAPGELENRLRERASLVQVAAEHLAWIHSLVEDVDHVVYLTDDEGVVLSARTNDPDLPARVGLEPGCDWSGSRMGVSGPAAALATGGLVVVLGPEHDARARWGYACVSAAILGPKGSEIGTVGLCTPLREAQVQRLVIVAYGAREIQAGLNGG